MEFEEIKQIWDRQDRDDSHTVNEAALLERVRAKKHGAIKTTTFSELFLVGVNLGAGVFILFANTSGDVYLYLMAGLMLLTVAFIIVGRILRIRRQQKFDETMLGELENALGIATYQVRLSLAMRWYGLPVGVLTALALGQRQTVWAFIPLVFVLGVAWLASSWEHRIYKTKKHDIELLRNSLLAESPISPADRPGDD